LEQWEEIDRERRRGEAYSNFGKGGVPAIPLPRPRPSSADGGGFPPVQSLEGATVQATVTGEVHGEVKQTIVVEPSPYLKALIQKAEQVVQLAGSLMGNGPGSVGHSSPDAAAPMVGFNGVP
jgi:hypothetical protein